MIIAFLMMFPMRLLWYKIVREEIYIKLVSIYLLVMNVVCLIDQ